MSHNTSYTKHLNSKFINIYIVILMLVSSLSAPLLVSGRAVADGAATVCQVTPADSGAALGVPTLLGPTNDSTNHNGFDFTWTSVDGAAQYDWESSLSPAMNPDGSFVNQLGHLRLGAASLNEAGSPQMTYYWHVRSVAADGTTSAWSQTWKATISNAQTSYLSAPTLLSPGNNATCNIYDQDFDFMWNAPVSDGGLSPLTYVFQSGKSATTDPVTGEFTDQPFTSASINTTSISDGGSPNGTYYWHVRAVGSDGTPGPWSATWVVAITRDAPVIVTPPADPDPGAGGSDTNTPPTTGSDTPVAAPSATPIVTAVSTTSSSTANTVSSLAVPPSADIAAVLGADTTTVPNKASDKKKSHHTALTANAAITHSKKFASGLIWVIALVLALSGAVFAYHRRQTSSK